MVKNPPANAGDMRLGIDIPEAQEAFRGWGWGVGGVCCCFQVGEWEGWSKAFQKGLKST